MPKLRNIVYLSEAQKQTLFTNGTITVGTTTVDYSDNDIYVVQQLWNTDGSNSNNYYIKDNTNTTRFTLSSSGMVTASGFSGSGASLTNLNADNISTGTVAVARLGTGTASASTWLRGDGAWTSLPTATQSNSGIVTLTNNQMTIQDMQGDGNVVTGGHLYTLLNNTYALVSHTHTASQISNATTLGQNLITLANGSAISFPRLNADNTVSKLSSSSFRAAIGASATSHTHSGADINSGLVSSTFGGTGVNNAGRTLTINTNSGTIGFTNAGTTLTVANTASVSGTNTGDQTTITGNAGTASAVLTSAENTGTTPRYLLFANAVSGNQSLKTDSGLTYHPTNNTITANLEGTASGNLTSSSSLSAGKLSGRIALDNLPTGTNGTVLKGKGTNDPEWGTVAWNEVTDKPSGDGNLYVPATSTTNNGKVLMAGSTAGSMSWKQLFTSDIEDNSEQQSLNHTLDDIQATIANIPTNTNQLTNGAGFITSSSSITGSAGSVANSITFNNGGSGNASGTTFNGSATRTISYNTVGAAASSHALTTHSDVTITSPANGQVLKYNGTNWVNSSDSNTNNYLSVVSGSANGTATFQRVGLSDLTWNTTHTHSEYVPTTRTISGKALSGNIWLDASDIDDGDRQQYLNQTLANLETGKLPMDVIIRSKNALTTTTAGSTAYSDTGLSVFLNRNSTYKISMTGHWERQSPGATAWTYRQSIVSSSSGVYMRGMWTWYPLDSYSGANTTIAYASSMVSYSGYTGQTVVTPSATTAVSSAPMCFEGYVVTGSSDTILKFTHGTSVSLTLPSTSAFRGVLTATKI